jgi:hypothetical protein
VTRGKHLSLEEAQKTGRMDEFIKQNKIPPKEQHPQARERFEKLLDLAASGERKQKPGKHKVR